VGEDDASAGEIGRELLQAGDEILIGKSMKPVSAHAFLGEAARKGKRLGEI
jgi:hypothetical protein